MLISRLGLPNIALPFYNADAGGGGGMTGDSGGADPGGGGIASEPAAEPSIIDISDDALIRIKGQDKPVKFGEHVRGFQAQHTKAAQRAAQLERQLQQEQAARQRYEEQARQAAARQQGGGGQEDVYASLRQLPYLSGEDAVRVVQGIAQDIQHRDQILLKTLETVKALRQTVQGLSQSHSTSAFEGKISKFLQEGGYDPNEYGDFAKELYVAYEGDDLDMEFPQILRSRIEQLEKAFAAKQAAKVQASRKTPFVPGRGGLTAPSKPLEIPANAKPSEIADLLFPTFERSGT